MILGINFAVSPYSIALISDHCHNDIYAENAYDFVENMTTSIDQLLIKNKCSLQDIKGIGIITGPGSYTSLRIGITTIKTLAKLNNIPTYPITTLEILIQMNALESGVYLSIMPAKPGEANLQLFNRNQDKISELSHIFSWSEDQIKTFISNINQNIKILGLLPQCKKAEIDALLRKNMSIVTLTGMDAAKYVIKHLADLKAVAIDTLLPIYSHDPFIGPKKK